MNGLTLLAITRMGYSIYLHSCRTTERSKVKKKESYRDNINGLFYRIDVKINLIYMKHFQQ